MSQFSGKCDLYDWLDTDKILFSKLTIYVGNSKEPLKIDYISDLIPYYPYVISVGGHNTVEKSANLKLMSESWVDYHERELLTSEMNDIKKFYRKCKRLKKEFNIKTVQDNVFLLFGADEGLHKEIIRRVLESGDKADVKGLHLPIYEHYRDLLYAEMVNNGYTEDEAKKWIWRE